MSNKFRNKFFMLLSIAFLLTAFIKESSAAVYGISGYGGSKIMSAQYRKTPCISKGYTLTKCIGKQKPVDFCPNDPAYFRTCACDSNKYKYDVYNCPYPKILSGDSCDGRFEFCSCDAKYKYNSKNCRSPKVLSGMTCDGNYENCSCPHTYYKTCTGNMIGSGQSCGGKFQSCKCASFYKTCSQGPDASASQCREEGSLVDKYSRCFGNSCENGGYLNFVPENQKCNEVKYFENTCYKDCRPLTCFDGGYYDRNPSQNITCPRIEFGGKMCYNCDTLCGYCEQFDGKCKIDCKNDCKKGMWFENKLNGGFVCKQ